MRWSNARRSGNVEDRRSTRAGKRSTRIGFGTVAIALILAWITGVNPLQMLGLVGEVQSSLPSATTAPASSSPPQRDDEVSEFVSVVLADMEDVWYGIFREAGAAYQPAKLVLFTDAVQSACGFNSSATGPFYCPSDRRVYLDVGFMQELKRLGASGDFALAYVIGHEVGHHVQNLVGTSSAVRQEQGRAGRAVANQLSVRLELQADCYAGVWAHHSKRRGIIEYDAGDFAEGIRTAGVIGDDRLQREAGRPVRPESFTHGTSDQRVDWLTRGLETGDVDACDTF
jgi:predicted metalloprotease